MKAVKLSTDPREKKLLNKRFNAAADVARSVKSNKWTPSKTLSDSQSATHQAALQPKSKADGIGLWAADAAQSASHVLKASESQSADATKNAFLAARITPQSVPPQNKSSIASPSNGPLPVSTQNNFNHENVLANHSPDTSHTEPDKIIQRDPMFHPQQSMQREVQQRSSKASVAHVRKLHEPISSRKRTTKEEIILLRASLVNGVKCPPWDKIPSADEFALDSSGFFTYVYTLTELAKFSKNSADIAGNPVI